jgi:hypothetical protein
MLKPEKFDPLRRSVGHVLDIIGEGWSILIIREAFLGTRRFEDFQGRLGIARNILTARLKKLCASQKRHDAVAGGPDSMGGSLGVREQQRTGHISRS